MGERPVVFWNQGGQLTGVLHEPEGEKNCGGVVFCHGFTGNKMESHRIFVQLARELAEAGFYALRFDFRGSGDSEGEFIDMTVTGEVSDTKAALAWLRENTDVDSARIALLGFSLGGCVAAYTAAEERVAVLILWSAVAEAIPVFTGGGAITYEVMVSRATEDGFWPMGGWQVGLPFLLELSQLCPLEKVKQYTGPVLLIHGSSDQVVPESHSYRYYTEVGCIDKEIVIVEGADHIFNKFTWKRTVIDKTIEWLQKRLK